MVATALVAHRGQTPLNAAGDSRTLMIVQWYREGRTLEEIGSVFGVTRERVRQIKERYEEQTGEKVKRPSGRLLVSPTDVLRIARRPDVKSPYVVGSELGIDNGAVMRLLGQLALDVPVRRLWRWRKKAERRRAYLAKFEKLAAELGHTPTGQELNRAFGGSAQQDFARVFGSLQTAATLAGLPPRAVGGPGHLDTSSRRPGEKVKRPSRRLLVAAPETPRDHVANAAQILLLAVRFSKGGQSVMGMVEDARTRLRAALDLLDAQEGK